MLRSLLALTLVCLASTARAQTSDPYRRWTAEFGIGWDNSISGNINSSAEGILEDQAVVILRNKYEEVYGTGLHLRFGGGYMISEVTELRATFTFQSLDADLTEMGDLGVSRLYGQYDDYQSFGMDFGARRYTGIGSKLRGYADGSIGMAFIDEIDVALVAPQANVAAIATDFYDKTAAFTFGMNAGVIWQLTEPIGVFTQLGLRYVSGLSEVDNLIGTGLEGLNNDSARWTIPFVFGIQTRF
jgi:hypothetical protein